MSDADPADNPPPNPHAVRCEFPVPPIGLTCPACRYDLTGLTEPRCPECGGAFDLDTLFDEGIQLNPAVRRALLADMLGDRMETVQEAANAAAQRTTTTVTSAVGILAQDYLDKTLDREPEPEDFAQFYDAIARDGRLLVPLPRPPRHARRDYDFPECDYDCPNCRKPLLDVRDWTCPHCQSPIEPAAVLPHRLLIALNRELGRNQNLPVLLMRTALEHEGIPNDAQSSAGSAMSTIGGVEFSALRVPRSYVFDALAHLEAIRDRSEAVVASEAEWTCGDCGEQIPDNFEVCWNCGAARP